jgi:hypothetical protein
MAKFLASMLKALDLMVMLEEKSVNYLLGVI